jgi:hypothetical protein
MVKCPLSRQLIGRPGDFQRYWRYIIWVILGSTQIFPTQLVLSYFESALIKDDIMSLVHSSSGILGSNRLRHHLDVFVTCESCCRAYHTVVEIAVVVKNSTATRSPSHQCYTFSDMRPMVEPESRNIPQHSPVCF